MEALANLGINPGFLLVFTLYFLLVVFVMARWVYTPVINALEARKQKIAQGLEDARVAAAARANAEAEAKKVIAEAQAEANRRVSEATERAEKAAADVKAAAETERARILKAAEDDIVAERNRVLGDLRGQVAALAMSAANKLIKDTLDEQRQRALINDFFSGVQAGRVVVLEGESVAGTAAEVTSALPLTPAEQDTVKRDITSKMGATASVSFKVDPNILGGLIIRVGDKIIDGSVAGQLEGLRQAVR
ncbi:MAG: F0F1 ATP synthase subunit B [Anaerolineales bacterium]|nr:F0F1 ATP synthase subunit B [Anaerolineales bacterium]